MRDNSVADKLQARVPAGVHIAKAFNTLSGYALEDTRRSRIACHDMDAVDKLSLVCARAGRTPVYEGKLIDAHHLEKLPHRLFPTWRFPLIVSVVVLTWWYLCNAMTGLLYWAEGSLLCRRASGGSGRWKLSCPLQVKHR